MTRRRPAAKVPGVPTDAAPAPAVRCSACGFAWNSPAMADGLRLLPGCPRCGGELAFRSAAPEAIPTAEAPTPAGAPHLVLGIPRRPGA